MFLNISKSKPDSFLKPVGFVILRKTQKLSILETLKNHSFVTIIEALNPAARLSQ